jgi:hypothetical protein
VQLVEQRLGLVQVKRVEAFGEPAMDRSEKRAGRIPFALLCGRQGWQFRKRGVERRLIQVAILKFAGEVIGIRLHVEVPIAR